MGRSSTALQAFLLSVSLVRSPALLSAPSALRGHAPPSRLCAASATTTPATPARLSTATESDAPLTVPWRKRPKPAKAGDADDLCDVDGQVASEEVEHRVVMMRHGESLFNRHNVFTGWCDVPLTEHGRAEAARAGRLMAGAGLQFDVVFCSVLQRSATTAHLALAACGQTYVEVRPRWELNERHYGALQGLDKARVEAEGDPVQVQAWRSSYHARPPPMAPSHPHYPLIANDRRYARLAATGQLPAAESIADTAVRVMDLWSREIAPLVRSGKRVLVVAHRNSLRALIRNLEGLDDAQVASLRIPTGAPFEYPLLGDKLRPVAPPLDCEAFEGRTLYDAALYAGIPVSDSDSSASAAASARAAAAAAAAAVAVAAGGRQVEGAVVALHAAGAVATPGAAARGAAAGAASAAVQQQQLQLQQLRQQQQPVGCGFQGRFLLEDEATAAWAANRATCLAEWDKDPAHPPDECLLAL